MSSRAMSLKGKIKKYAKDNNIAAQVVLQNYMFERFLVRLAISEYRDKFVIKGGMLIASIVGLDTRSTMDLDATLRNLPLTEEKITEAIDEICKIEMYDDVQFIIKSIKQIRKDDIYGGYSVRLEAIYDSIITPLSIDISTGDVITPNAVEYEFSEIFNADVSFSLWGYNIETVLAEKVETILRRGVFTTRPRDYYDVYILVKKYGYDYIIFTEALRATAEHRGSKDLIANELEILEQISKSVELKDMWGKYQKKFNYASEITFNDVIVVLRDILRKQMKQI